MRHSPGVGRSESGSASNLPGIRSKARRGPLACTPGAGRTFGILPGLVTPLPAPCAPNRIPVHRLTCAIRHWSSRTRLLSHLRGVRTGIWYENPGGTQSRNGVASRLRFGRVRGSGIKVCAATHAPGYSVRTGRKKRTSRKRWFPPIPRSPFPRSALLQDHHALRIVVGQHN